MGVRFAATTAGTGVTEEWSQRPYSSVTCIMLYRDVGFLSASATALSAAAVPIGVLRSCPIP